jgi:hypothetical protein
LRSAVVIVVATTFIACRGVPNTLGPDRRTARTNADALLDGLATRFDNVQRSPKFFQARSKLGRYALSPSGVYRDTSVWTSVSPSDSTRTLTLSGSHTATGYLFNAMPAVATPNATGASRHVIQLKRRGESEYDWDTTVDHAIGPVRANEIAATLDTYLLAAERSTNATVRADNQALFPRASRVLGELFTLDTIRLTPQPDRSTSVMVRFHMNPERIKGTRPNFAKYLDKYVSPARYRLRLLDGRGPIWFDAAGDDNAFTMSYRIRDGQLVALTGTPTPMPDSLKVALDFSAKFMIFRVGVTSLIGDFVFDSTARERGWSMRFNKEPDWHFPLAVNNLIRTSLRHPFAGNGITLRVAIRNETPTQALLTRHARLSVQESAIVRWLGGLGNSAMNDFAGRAEVEENRYVFEVLSALRADVVAALSGGE